MKIVIDEAIPFIHGVFEPYAEVIYKEGKAICREDLIDAAALIVRTRTKCNAELLDGTAVKIIATATIGMDHIDIQYCTEHGIFIQNAAGCNAGGVMNYVISAIYGICGRRGINLGNSTLGIVGVGHVGSRIERAAKILGIKTLLCDPPRARVENKEMFCDLEYLLENSDIVTMHVPLNETTTGMANSEFFSRMKPGAMFINAARGEIVDEAALKEYINILGPVVLDTWCNEPDIDKELMDMVAIATPHIAGYSYTGKQNGTMTTVRSVARFLEISELFDFFPEAEISELEATKLEMGGKTQGEIASAIQYNYPIFTDDFLFRMNPDNFEQFRTEYRYRREFYIN